jgi:hypothetical protein
VASNDRHKAWLDFVRRAVNVPLGYSKEELRSFRSLAKRENPSLVPVIEAYLDLAERSDTYAEPGLSRMKRPGSSQMHLFDLLRERKFFPQNLDLAHFAERVLPHLKTHRFDKMSRSDIAARIIEHIENSDRNARNKLEQSMREALNAMKRKPAKNAVADRESFLSRWERIIKGLEL